MFMGGQTFKPRSIIKQHKTYCLSTFLDLIDRKAASWRVTSGVRGIERGLRSGKKGTSDFETELEAGVATWVLGV